MNESSHLNNIPRDTSALVDMVRAAAESIDTPAGVHPANVVELFRVAQRYETAMAAVDAIARMQPK
jgi:predicted urease superfamily metal-dependent hydrolase